ncbi:MAG: S4 domain-containing protein [Acidithiobacillus sp.]|uniref:S4 domain-containing protein n=1 Tax=Acidithiobacillus sp. TaxID=1872118 RepID=UPI0025B8B58B|nr:S4 domain-containing protein [Acidithiobacillus sp.]
MTKRAPDGLRLDLFLKMARLIKRRSLAKTICDGGCVTLNGRTAKAASEVRAGDALCIDIRDRYLELRVLRLPTRIEGPDGVVDIIRHEERPR